MNHSKSWLCENCSPQKFPGTTREKRTEFLPSGIAALDAQTGGLPLGAVTEISGSSGSGTLLIHTFLESFHHHWALIDCTESFAVEQGEPTSNMLCVLCRDLTKAIKATDLLLRDGNLRMVVLDLQLLHPRSFKQIPISTWYRFQQLIESSLTTFVGLTQNPIIPNARFRVHLENKWSLKAMEERRTILLQQLEFSFSARGTEYRPQRVYA